MGADLYPNRLGPSRLGWFAPATLIAARPHWTSPHWTSPYWASPYWASAAQDGLENAVQRLELIVTALAAKKRCQLPRLPVDDLALTYAILLHFLVLLIGFDILIVLINNWDDGIGRTTILVQRAWFLHHGPRSSPRRGKGLGSVGPLPHQVS